jgi:hypothetical protein
VTGQEVTTDQTGSGPALLAKVQKTRFKTVAGASDVHKEIDGAWKRWDSATQAWV